MVGGVNFDCLVDSGSQVSTISKGAFDFLSSHSQSPVFMNLKIEDAGFLVVSAANGSELCVLGFVVIPELWVGSDCIRDSFFLVVQDRHDETGKSRPPLLLGTNVLDSHPFVFQRAGLCSVSCAVRTEACNGKRLRRVDSSVPICVPARTCVNVPVTSSVGKAPVKVTPVPSYRSRTLKCLPTICSADCVFVAVVNPGAHDVWINGGEMIASVSPFDDFLDRQDKLCVDVNEVGVAIRHVADNISDPFSIDSVKPGCELSLEEASQFRSVLDEFKDVFSKNSEDLGFCSVVPHVIRTTDEVPVKLSPHRLHPALIPRVKRELERLLRAGVIRKSTSPYSAPVVIVSKKDSDEIRMCIDYRGLAKKIIHHAMPLPRIQDTLQMAGGSKYFTTLDLTAGYNQIALDEGSRQKSAFSCGWGLYEFITTPFGLKNAGATFTQNMETIFEKEMFEFLLLYLDDILVMSKDFSSHLEHLRVVFSKLRAANLKIKLPKCRFFCSEVKYLGHLLTPSGIKCDPAKVKAVAALPVPSSYQELSHFLGLSGFYRSLIRDFAKIVSPLHNVMCFSPSHTAAVSKKRRGKKSVAEKSRPFSEVWSPECTAAFEHVKSLLLKDPVLAYPDFSKPFVVHVDASYRGLGGVLMQEQDGKLVVISYASRTLRPHERNEAYLSSKRLEFCALRWCVVERFRPYLSWSHFVLFTDNNPLAFLKSSKLSATEVRWVAQLAQFSFDVVFKHGRVNKVADSLSRLPVPESDVPEVSTADEFTHIPLELAEVLRKRFADSRSFSVDASVVCVPPIPEFSKDDLRKEQALDVSLFHAFSEARKGSPLWFLEDGLLFRLGKCEGVDSKLLVIPSSLQSVVLDFLHTRAGHQGVNKTLSLSKSRYFWFSMDKAIRDFVQNCDVCRESKPPPRKMVVPRGSFIASRPGEVVCCDFTVLDKASDGTENVLVLTDVHSRFTVCVPTKDQRAKTVADALAKEWIYRFGLMSRLHSDRGRSFENLIVEELCSIFGVRKSRTAAYHPQSNAFPERFNRTLHDLLRVLSADKKRKWPRYLPEVTWLYNITPHSVTKFSPFFLFFGRSPKLPADLLFGVKKPVVDDWSVHQRQRLELAWDLATRRSRLASESRNSSLVPTKSVPDLSVNQPVLLRKVHVGRSKLEPYWSSVPFVVRERIGPYTYKVQRSDGVGSVLVRRREDLLAAKAPLSDSVVLPALPSVVSPAPSAAVSDFDPVPADRPPRCTSPLSSVSFCSLPRSDCSSSDESRSPSPVRRSKRVTAGRHRNVHHLPAYLRSH